MIQFLVDLLTPVFIPMGVSTADLTSYLTMCSKYVYIVLALVLALIVVMIGAHFVVKKGKRHLVRWTGVLAFVLAMVLVVNLVCFGPLYNNISGALNAVSIDLNEDTEQQSKDTIKQIGEEGLVLVKNDGLLPLSSDTQNLNVFGWDSSNPLFGGVGSGASDGSSAVGILQSLQDAGYATNEELSKMYTDYCAERPGISMSAQDWTLPEPTAEYYTDELMANAEEFSDTAVIAIGRSGGEGADLPTDMKAVIDGEWSLAKEVSINAKGKENLNYQYTNGTYTNNGDYDDFDEGEHYLQLSNTEEAMIDLVCSKFEHVIVVINASNTMELGWVDEYDSIGAVILAPGTGETGMSALGEIINGTVNPSGKTADTFVKDLTTTPTYQNAGNFSYTNVDDLKKEIAKADGAYQGNIAFVNYVESIYVGYKFYETAQEEGLITYEDYVQYPFGYGLSYTEFTQEITDFSAGDEMVSFNVKVTNTGDVAGKDVVEIYYTPPYNNGGIEKASVNLVQYGKTELLEPGKSETLTFTIALEDMVSYDSQCIKTENGGYILEAGEYKISLRSDSHTVLAEESFTLDADKDYSKEGRSTDEAVATNQFADYSTGTATYLSRADGFANYAEATAAPLEEAYVMDDETRGVVEANSTAHYDGTQYDNESDEMPAMDADKGLQLSDLTGKTYDDPDWDKLLDQMSFDDMVTLINVGGWQTAEITSVGKIATSDCDGPAGVSNFVTGVYGTAYPSEILMAQTWNQDLLYLIGASMGQEYAEANNYGWYGPAMNTHRSAFGGRNFEYYSEDGVLAGYLASAEVNGAATQGVYAYIKHFAVNDQETNRCSFLMTYATEQTIRETYLKPFEIAVKNFEGTAQAVMSAYNWIGTVACCNNSNLLNNVLREEWGFVGVVITDYNGSYGYMSTDNSIRNGNDLMLGYSKAESNKLEDQSATAVLAMRQACKNILYTVGNSGYYVDGTEVTTGGINKMQKLFYMADIVAVAVVLLLAAAVFGRYFWKKKRQGTVEVVETTEEKE
ncbi:MAG: glycoside hydrolase family 3 C-terminal domain-containing protein [Lachnospiraceae bacterium]|nr:glycoside hydrolase family 3 C-terminal domain-containing protein [Lachnospiraceae bacterium]